MVEEDEEVREPGSEEERASETGGVFPDVGARRHEMSE